MELREVGYRICQKCVEGIHSNSSSFSSLSISTNNHILISHQNRIYLSSFLHSSPLIPLIPLPFSNNDVPIHSNFFTHPQINKHILIFITYQSGFIRIFSSTNAQMLCIIEKSSSLSTFHGTIHNVSIRDDHDTIVFVFGMNLIAFLSKQMILEAIQQHFEYIKEFDEFQLRNRSSSLYAKMNKNCWKIVEFKDTDGFESHDRIIRNAVPILSHRMLKCFQYESKLELSVELMLNDGQLNDQQKSTHVSNENALIVVGKAPIIGMYLLKDRKNERLNPDGSNEKSGNARAAVISAARGMWNLIKNQTQSPVATLEAKDTELKCLNEFVCDVDRRVGVFDDGVERECVNVRVNEKCGLYAGVDKIGRVFVGELIDGNVLQVIKGCRDADVSWIESGLSEFGSVLLILAPKRMVVEVWNPLNPVKLVAFRVPNGTQLIQHGNQTKMLLPNGMFMELFEEQQQSMRINNIDNKEKTTEMDSVDDSVLLDEMKRFILNESFTPTHFESTQSFIRISIQSLRLIESLQLLFEYLCDSTCRLDGKHHEFISAQMHSRAVRILLTQTHEYYQCEYSKIHSFLDQVGVHQNISLIYEHLSTLPRLIASRKQQSLTENGFDKWKHVLRLQFEIDLNDVIESYRVQNGYETHEEAIQESDSKAVLISSQYLSCNDFIKSHHLQSHLMLPAFVKKQHSNTMLAIYFQVILWGSIEIPKELQLLTKNVIRFVLNDGVLTTHDIVQMLVQFCVQLPLHWLIHSSVFHNDSTLSLFVHELIMSNINASESTLDQLSHALSGVCAEHAIQALMLGTFVLQLEYISEYISNDSLMLLQLALKQVAALHRVRTSAMRVTLSNLSRLSLYTLSMKFCEIEWIPKLNEIADTASVLFILVLCSEYSAVSSALERYELSTFPVVFQVSKLYSEVAIRAIRIHFCLILKWWPLNAHENEETLQNVHRIAQLSVTKEAFEWFISEQDEMVQKYCENRFVLMNGLENVHTFNEILLQAKRTIHQIEINLESTSELSIRCLHLNQLINALQLFINQKPD
uniref:Rab3-GAP regulatory subunit N-terminal domain-containing protein n=1 Tax=Timspurckia oligopyrenoides TaxID=708627 RepID=A0A7S0ZD50_9RHOD